MWGDYEPCLIIHQSGLTFQQLRLFRELSIGNSLRMVLLRGWYYWLYSRLYSFFAKNRSFSPLVTCVIPYSSVFLKYISRISRMLFLWSRMNGTLSLLVPQEVHLPETYLGKKKNVFADVIKWRILIWGGHPGFSRWYLSPMTNVLDVQRRHRHRGEKRTMWRDYATKG